MFNRVKTFTPRHVSFILITFFALAIYWLSSAGHTPHDYFTRLSDAFLQGKYYLTENPPWLNELIPAGGGKFYVAYPPMPAIAALPFRYVFGQNFYQDQLSQLLGAGIAALTMQIAWAIKKDKKLLIWIGLLSAFGNIIWYLSATGSSWYIGQVTAAFFLTAALLESVTKRRPVIVGLFLGASFLARLQTILALPIFLYQIFDKKDWLKNYIKLGLGLMPAIGFNFYYNFIRFGTILDKGYYLIPNVLNEPWFERGIFSLTYIPNGLKTIFASLPKFQNKFHFVTPSWGGLAIWITTPAFVYALLANIKDRLVMAAWLSVLLISLVIFSHGTNGFAQFGYRFAVDFYPILFLLTIKSLAKSGIKWHHWLLLGLSILVNLWGVLWINKFGWVSY